MKVIYEENNVIYEFIFITKIVILFVLLLLLNYTIIYLLNDCLIDLP